MREKPHKYVLGGNGYKQVPVDPIFKAKLDRFATCGSTPFRFQTRKEEKTKICLQTIEQNCKLKKKINYVKNIL